MVFRRFVPTSSRGFSTTSASNYQYTLREAVRMTGPLFPKTNERSQLDKNNSSETADQPLPLALSLRPPVLDMNAFPLGTYLETATPGKLNETVGPRDDARVRMIKNEAGLIRLTGSYFLDIVEYLVPDLLESLGYKKELVFETEESNSSSTPDIVIRYDDKPVVILDYKGPNCIFDDELAVCSAGTVDEARSKLGILRLKKSRNRTKNYETLLAAMDITLDTVVLIQQGVKYSKVFKTPTVLFYDYDTLLALEVPQDLHDRKPGVLLDATIWKETEKSTESSPVYSDNNHIAVLLYHVVRAVKRYEESLGN